MSHKYKGTNPIPHVTKIRSFMFQTLNSEQALAVTGISKAILEHPREPRICLLQGPPGTGKSHTILALIHQILFVS